MEQDAVRLYMQTFAWAMLAASSIGVCIIACAGYLLFRKDK